MSKYHKIQSVFKRDPENNYKTFLEGEYSLPEFYYLAHNGWVFTEKIDGANIRVYWDGTDVRFEGRTDKAQIPTFLLEQLTEMFPPEVFSTFTNGSPGVTSVVLYGEGYGAKIQKGGGNYISDGVSFVLFDVRIGDWWLERSAVNEVAETLGIKSVPTVGFGTLIDMVQYVREGFDSIWGPFEAEGLVARPTIELSARNGKRIITKLKCKDFK